MPLYHLFWTRGIMSGNISIRPTRNSKPSGHVNMIGFFSPARRLERVVLDAANALPEVVNITATTDISDSGATEVFVTLASRRGAFAIFVISLLFNVITAAGSFTLSQRGISVNSIYVLATSRFSL